MSGSPSNYPRITLAAVSFVVGVLTTAVTAGITFGEARSDLTTAKERVADLQKAGEKADEEYRATLKTWRDAYNNQTQSLQAAQSRVQELENDRCNAIKTDVDSIYASIDYAQRNYPERLNDLNRMMEQYQLTLRACYSATSGSARG
jgi:small-conductance mechanosensitive channel